MDAKTALQKLHGNNKQSFDALQFIEKITEIMAQGEPILILKGSEALEIAAFVEKQEEKFTEAKQMLTLMEWDGAHRKEWTCPCCKKGFSSGHLDVCWLGNFIKDIRAGKAGEYGEINTAARRF